ncbi:MAG: response regulator [Thermoplasmatales archaeon]|nr:response regulator [Thermoplasmatales archaeon]
MKVMVVDDDPTIVDAIKTLLKTEGHEPAGMYSGEECLNNLKGEVDLILLDIKMPGMNGIETLRNIKRIKPDTYVVMLTAFATVDTAVEAMKEGAFDYIRKPFAMEDMKEVLMDVIEDIKLKKNHKVVGLMEGGDLDCFEVFKNVFRNNVKGMCVTTEKPETIDERYALKNVSYVWLTEENYIGEPRGKEQERMGPKEIEKLKTLIERFITENENTAILISSMEALIRKNLLGTIKEFIYYLDEKVRTKNTSVILSVSPESRDVPGLTEIENRIADLYIRHISESISNPLRRNIILTLDANRECSFTRIAKEVRIRDSPKLSFHLRKLKSSGIVEQNDEKKYFLTKTGEEAAVILKDMKKGDVKVLKNIVWMTGKREKTD